MNNLGRDYWSFPFTVGRVLAAAKKREHYHEERMAFWGAQVDQAEEDMRKSVTFKEPVSSGTRTSFAGGGVQVDYEAQNRFNDARSHQSHHKRQYEDYHAYVVGLSERDQTETLALTANDIRHFGLDGLPFETDDED